MSRLSSHLSLRLSISLLGPFRVTLEGQPFTGFESDKVRALLAYLALESGVPHRREALAGLLWPEWPGRAARRNLSQALYNLRAALGDRETTSPLLTVTHQAICLDRSNGHWLDAAAFVRLLDEVKVHSHPRLAACEGCLDRLEQAVTLYRGEFLAGFSLGDSAPFEEWMLLQQERFHRLAVDALRRLAACSEQRGAYDRGLAHARRWATLEPWQERAHRQAMRLLDRSGERNAALAQYETCRRALREELAVEPSAETTRLYERIRSGLETPVAVSSPPHNLPAQLIPFVGREETLAAIEERLRDPGCRLLTLVGPGGSGKTRLALEAAARQVDRYPHGVWFVQLAPLQSVELIVPAIAQELGLSFTSGEGPGRQDVGEQLLYYLRQKNMLLVLDNFEHLVEGAKLVPDILRTAPEVDILVTSRRGLHVQGEHRCPISGMNYPDDVSIEDALQYSAVRLFTDSARRARPGFALTDDNVGDVARICRLVEGMPLGLLLAAAWIKMLTPSEILAEIDPALGPESGRQMTGIGLDFLASDLRDVPERQRSMRAVFDHSWKLLTERERAVMQALPIFRGGSTREAAQEIAGASLRDLMSLVDLSLVQRDAPSRDGRFELHELLRQYAGEKLGQTPETQRAVRDRHSVYYTSALQRWARELKVPHQQATLAEMDAEIDNVRAAWNWAVEERQADRLGLAMEGLALFCDWRVRYEEGESAFRAAADALNKPAKGTKEALATALRVRALALAWQGHFCTFLGRANCARDLLRTSLSLLDGPAYVDPAAADAMPAGSDIRREKALVLQVMGEIEYRAGHFQEAESPCAQSLALYRALDDRWQMANVLYALGVTVQALGDFEEAKQLHQEGLDIFRAVGDRKGITDSLIRLAFVAQDWGQFKDAERLEQQALAICRSMGDRATLVRVLRHLGPTLGWRGKFAEAHSVFKEGVALCQDLGSPDELAFASFMLGFIQANLGQYGPARVLIQRGLELVRETGVPWRIGLALLLLSFLPLIEGDFIEARCLLQESAVAFRGIQNQTGWILAMLGCVACEMGDLDQARQHLCQALQIAAEIRSVLPLMFALPSVAVLLAVQGRAERAVDIYALASRWASVSRSCLWKTIVGRHISAAAATLPPEVVAAAQERGRARELWATVEELLDELDIGEG